MGYAATILRWGKKKFQLNKRDRYLRGDELERLGAAVVEAEHVGVNSFSLEALRFLLLSGCRKARHLNLEWSWIDFEHNLIALPDTKTGPRQLHLGSAARLLLERLPRMHGSRYVFPSSRGSGPIVGLRKVWEDVRHRAGLDDVRIHDLRHSFASSAVSAGQSL